MPTSVKNWSFAFPAALLLLCGLFQSPLCADEPADDPASAVSEEPTHQQTAIIKVVDDAGAALPLHTFCLSKEGNILAGVGESEGQVRVYNGEGELLKTWSTSVNVEAINVAPNGTVVVAGSGKVLRYTPDGKLLAEESAPHAAALTGDKDALREQIINQLKQRAEMYSKQGDTYKQMIKRYEGEIAKIKDKDASEISADDEKKIQQYERYLESFTRAIENYAKYADRYAYKEPTGDEIKQQIENLIATKMGVSSISATEDDVFLVCRAQQGYGFDVWRTDANFENGEKVIASLSGCCGQMDVQANGDGLFVALNTRKRVCRYDRDGKMILEWGSSDREGLLGFGSCCNPMNVAFGPNGDVYTAEATSGRIKRYSNDGKLLSLVGTVDLVPGCKKVSIAVSADGSRVYMLDITRSHILVMSAKEAAPVEAVSTTQVD